MTPRIVPDCIFHTRVRNDAIGGPNPYEWKDVTARELFGGRNIVLFALPGAFTPACSDSHLPGYEEHHEEFRKLGIDQVICLSVNDAFVMFQWAKAKNIECTFMLPDGNGDFTRLMGMLVQRRSRGMGLRSWRYSMHVRDRQILKLFAEPGFADEPDAVGVEESGAERMLSYLRESR